MTELVEFEDNEHPNEEAKEMGSLNHGIAQANLTALFYNDERFRAITELSLDPNQLDLKQFGVKAKDELIPDICLYQKKQAHPKQARDIMKMTEMPVTVLEILSPKQSIDEILAKFEAYFALSVKSCWLVVPSLETVTVYANMTDYKSFGTHESEVIDEMMDIHLPIQKIFAW
ncbi:MAG TPA: Uma2 family endonuclease [Thiotrichaceae bacterium]|nr:Uma2 family endonuclease [Thiotrichaceae bacterium]